MSAHPETIALSARRRESAFGTVKPSEAEAFWFWLKLGRISFGGPAGQIAIMHEELVERRKGLAANMVS